MNLKDATVLATSVYVCIHVMFKKKCSRIKDVNLKAAKNNAKKLRLSDDDIGDDDVSVSH